jgi:hypothetical protein
LTADTNVCTLVGLLSDRSYEEMFLSGILIDHIPIPGLINSEEAGVVVCELSNVIRDALARATGARLDEASRLWATTEEFILDGWDEEQARSWAGELVTLARRARDLLCDHPLGSAVPVGWVVGGDLRLVAWRSAEGRRRGSVGSDAVRMGLRAAPLSVLRDACGGFSARCGRPL